MSTEENSFHPKEEETELKVREENSMKKKTTQRENHQKVQLSLKQYRSELEKRGLPIGPYDLQIAAHAKSLNAVLVTNNTKELNRIGNLKVEN